MRFAGLDPTGGAGLQAVIESIVSLGAHALPVITTVTAQDTHDLKSSTALGVADVVQQARAVLEDVPVQVFKLGVLGSVHIIEAVHTVLTDYPHTPVVTMRCGSAMDN